MKYRNIARKFLATATVMAGSATMAMAAIDPLDEAAIKTGITGADVLFYSLGGAILVVLAGVWGFKMVKRLF